ncbi:MAG: DUF2059 domain-containing protein [Pseudomonadota bacterium]|uniref:DUF2059 domain-containing protein n=1 Tax=Polaromonas aquatica TaxID=332657 RepID=A0ABW1TS39_9BURK
MKKLLTALAIASLAFSTAGHAQTADPKLEWATKVVTLQQGPELERMIGQLADSATQEVLQNWGPKLQTDVPKARQQQVTDELNAELKKCFDDISKAINSKVGKVSTDTLIPAYMDRFTLDELKQLAAFFESPTIKKYQAAAPELGGLFVKQLIEATRTDVTARVKQFDSTAAKIIGASPAPKAAPSTSGSSEKSKPATKK